MLIGGVTALMKAPSAKLSSLIQHFAAGVVFAAVILELIPQVVPIKYPFVFIGGFCCGLLLMLTVKTATKYLAQNYALCTIPWSLIIGVAIDMLVDGLLIGIAFLSGVQGGILVAVALAIQLFFVGLATMNVLRKKISIFSCMSLLVALAALIIIGAISGGMVLSMMSLQTNYAVIAFGVAALLYLVTEELLEQAHHTQNTPIITSTFFLGFLIIMLLGGQLTHF